MGSVSELELDKYCQRNLPTFTVARAWVEKIIDFPHCVEP